jgi:hypothetical protein
VLAGFERCSSLGKQVARIYKTELFERVKRLEDLICSDRTQTRAPLLLGQLGGIRHGIMHLQEVIKDHPSMIDEALDETPVR